MTIRSALERLRKIQRIDNKKDLPISAPPGEMAQFALAESPSSEREYLQLASKNEKNGLAMFFSGRSKKAYKPLCFLSFFDWNSPSHVLLIADLELVAPKKLHKKSLLGSVYSIEYLLFPNVLFHPNL